MKPKLAIVIAFLGAVGVILYLAVGRGRHGDASPTPRPTASSAPRIELSFEYSTEKQAWLEAAVAEFERQHPDVHVTLIGKGSLEAANAILDGTDRPVLWSPADSLVVNLCAADWQTKNEAPLFAAAGEPLVLTPLVFVVWEERANVLVADGSGRLPWKTIRTAVTSRKGWAGLGGKPGWGFVTLGHTDPTKSNSGMQALVLMAYEYFGVTSGLTVEQLLDPKFQELVKDIERGVSHLENSSATFMRDMLMFGPSKYDIAVVYESLAISQIDQAAGRWGKLKVYYPSTTIWSDHPIALLNGSWVTPDQKKAARQYIAFLRTKDSQQRALQYGFRPADTSVPIVTNDAQNPFTRLASEGITVDVPPAAETPEGPLVRNLMMMWTRVVQH